MKKKTGQWPALLKMISQNINFCPEDVALLGTRGRNVQGTYYNTERRKNGRNLNVDSAEDALEESFSLAQAGPPGNVLHRSEHQLRCMQNCCPHRKNSKRSELKGNFEKANAYRIKTASIATADDISSNAC